MIFLQRKKQMMNLAFGKTVTKNPILCHQMSWQITYSDNSAQERQDIKSSPVDPESRGGPMA